MAQVGILPRHERLELIGGEVVPMSPKGSFHERLKVALSMYWAQRISSDLVVATETTLRLSPDTYLEPDFVVYPKRVGWDGLSAGTATLVVELSDSSLVYDLGRKAELYGRFGIVELWVVNAVTRETRIHREPGPGGYGRVRDLGSDEVLTPACDPGLAVKLGDLDLY